MIDSRVYFTDIQPTDHYTQEHEKDVPWSTVVEIIFSTKNPKKKGDKFEIEKDGYYILFEIKDNILFVINAKKG
ncbi:hypothetical protein J4460_05335 [Candidatus Woesearchaeota archaeon]|nr:hypothetical protein [Candidatus Woesearchaeota archaeon]HIH38120.1 hypothetical protein [Candidatus Woesearchaeota archaeon]HIJ04379.1 hypothetical protein [Candidatus Woesearchaeota archaeon]